MEAMESWKQNLGAAVIRARILSRGLTRYWRGARRVTQEVLGLRWTSSSRVVEDALEELVREGLVEVNGPTWSFGVRWRLPLKDTTT